MGVQPNQGEYVETVIQKWKITRWRNVVVPETVFTRENVTKAPRGENR